MEIWGAENLEMSLRVNMNIAIKIELVNLNYFRRGCAVVLYS